MPRAFKVRQGNQVVGLFVMLAVAIVAAAAVMGPRTQRWFTPTRTLAIQLPPEGALGLRKGADVQILGSVVGTVDDIIVTDKGEMEAEISVRGNFINFVRKDSFAIIRKPLGIGDASIEITRGRGEALPVRGAVLTSVADKAPTQMMEETLTAFRNEAVPAIKEARGAISEYTKLASELRGEQKNVEQLLEHLNHLGNTLEHGQGLASVLFNDPGPTRELRAALPKINASLEDLQMTLRGARSVTERLPELEKSAKKAVDSVPGLVLQVQETSRQIQRLTEALQRNWLVRGTMDQAGPERRTKSDRVGTDR
jgi:ABC-type transporter Mla subunit MlaD